MVGFSPSRNIQNDVLGSSTLLYHFLTTGERMLRLKYSHLGGRGPKIPSCPCASGPGEADVTLCRDTRKWAKWPAWVTTSQVAGRPALPHRTSSAIPRMLQSPPVLGPLGGMERANKRGIGIHFRLFMDSSSQSIFSANCLGSLFFSFYLCSVSCAFANRIPEEIGKYHK